MSIGPSTRRFLFIPDVDVKMLEKKNIKTSRTLKTWKNFLTFISGAAEARVIKFCKHVSYVKFQQQDDKYP